MRVVKGVTERDDELNRTAGDRQRRTEVLRHNSFRRTKVLRYKWASKAGAAEERRVLQQIAPRELLAHFTFHS